MAGHRSSVPKIAITPTSGPSASTATSASSLLTILASKEPLLITILLLLLLLMLLMVRGGMVNFVAKELRKFQ